jgi:hypothetical protein
MQFKALFRSACCTAAQLPAVEDNLLGEGASDPPSGTVQPAAAIASRAQHPQMVQCKKISSEVLIPPKNAALSPHPERTFVLFSR